MYIWTYVDNISGSARYLSDKVHGHWKNWRNNSWYALHTYMHIRIVYLHTYQRLKYFIILYVAKKLGDVPWSCSRHPLALPEFSKLPLDSCTWVTLQNILVLKSRYSLTGDRHSRSYPWDFGSLSHVSDNSLSYMYVNDSYKHLSVSFSNASIP